MDGEVEKLEVKGAVFLTLNDPKRTKAAVQLNCDSLKGFTFRPHIELNRSSWNKQKQLVPNDTEAGFPANTRIDAVRYKFSSKDESDLPFIINIFNS